MSDSLPPPSRVSRPAARSSGGRPPARPPQGVSFGPIPNGAGHRIVLYGPGGVGKTTLASVAPEPLAIFDLEASLPALKPQLPVDVQRQIRCVEGIDSWQGIRDALNAPGWDSISTIIIDSATRAEELAVSRPIAPVASPIPKAAICRTGANRGRWWRLRRLYGSSLAR